MRSSLSLCLLWAIACGDDLAGVRDGSPDAGSPPPDAGSSLAIEREQAGGVPGAVVLAGDLAYVAVGPRLAIWRDGEQVGESDPLPGIITGVARDGDRAFVAQHTDLFGQVHVLDVSDPAQPVETTRFALVEQGPTIPLGLAVAGDRLFVADQDRASPRSTSPIRTIPRSRRWSGRSG